MPDGPKPTQKMKTSSGQIPHVGGPKPGGTGKIPVQPATARMKVSQRNKPEVVSSSDDGDLSEVRARVAPPPSAAMGLSLKWKIVIAMAAVTVATTMLIFVSVKSKAVAQLSDETDAKGIRLVRTLASIDAPLWKAAMGSGKPERKNKIDFLLSKANPEMTGGAREAFLRQSPEIKSMYDQLIDPLGPLHTLKGDKNDVGGGSEILQITVVDPTGGAGSVTAVEGTGEKGISISTRHRDPSGVEIGDGRDKGSDQEVRLYRMEKNGLDFNVILSLARINEAQGALKSSILLPVMVSILAGIGIAVWIGTLITNPIKHLMHDMNQVSSGNLEHRTVPHSKDEVGLLAQTFGRMTEALRAAHEQEVQQKALEHDLAIASEIQSNLVPKRMLKVENYDISAYYRPSKEVGGDYYDFIQIDEDNEGVIVADVSGKGVPGSLVMTMARAFIRMEAERSRNTSPADTLMKANRMLAQDIKKGMFVTALYCILNKRTNELRVASAGHNPLVVWRAATNQVQLVNPNGIALGFDKGPVFERTVKDEKIVLGHGDRIVAFTDGTVEAMNADNQEFGDERFYTLIRDLAPRDSNQMLNLIVKALDDHKGNAPQSDDITIVTLRYL